MPRCVPQTLVVITGFHQHCFFSSQRPESIHTTTENGAPMDEGLDTFLRIQDIQVNHTAILLLNTQVFEVSINVIRALHSSVK